MSTPYWSTQFSEQLKEELLQTTPLAEDITADVCVVGGGIGGLTAAHLLHKKGLDVVVLERGLIGRGETARSSAHLSNALDEGYSLLKKRHGAHGAQLAAESHTHALNLVESIVQEVGARCDFHWVPGYLFKGRDVPDTDLQEEFEASQRAKVPQVHTLPKVPWDFFDTGPCICYPRQVSLNPLAYLADLAGHLSRQGVRIYTNSPVGEVHGGSKGYVVTEDNYRVAAKNFVIATNSPIYGKVLVHTKQYAYRTYIIGMPIKKGSIPDAFYWDMEDPYHYVRIAPYTESEDLVIVGGEDHRTGEEENTHYRFASLEVWAKDRISGLGPVHFRWSGQILEPMDGLALLGRHKDRNVFIITGDSGHGMTHTAIGAILACDLISGNKNPWKDLYDPGRFRLKSSGDFLVENAKVVGHYSEWLRKERADLVHNLKPGEGVVIQKGFNKIAVSKDENTSVIYTRSAVCTHMGCVLHWNDVEKSWDCPCHGSRFSKQGEVLSGPAINSLS